MAFTRNRSRNSSSILLAVLTAALLASPDHAEAAFASQFSIAVGEEYNDNIFFRKDKESDFITSITPTFSIFYAPGTETAPTANLNISPSGQFFARNSELNNFGENVSVDGGYTYRYSPRLNFHVSDRFERLGETRTSGLAGSPYGGVQLPAVPTSPAPVGGSAPFSEDQDLKDFVSRGDQLTNRFSLSGSYLHREDIRFTAGYTNRFTTFLDQGGNEVAHNVHFRGIYNWRKEHNLHAGYSLGVIKTRDGENNIIHNFDFGDDYFTNYVYTVPITPTLTLSAKTGLSVNTGNSGPRVANNTNITLVKLWERATLAAGMNKGLTPSFGISGISDTTSFFMNFQMRLLERLSLNSGADFSLYDTDDVNFKNFQARLGLHYFFNNWLSSGLTYRYRWIDSGAGAARTELLERGKVSSNSVFLVFTARFELWPRLSLGTSMTSPTLAPVITTPFPALSPPPSGAGPAAPAQTP